MEDGARMIDRPDPPKPADLSRPRRRRTVVAGVLVMATFVAASVFTVLQPAGADQGAELVLKPGDKKVIVSDRPMGSTGIGSNGPASPMDCAEDPTIATACDVYPLKFELDTTEGALNFVSIRVDFETPTVPSLSLVAAANVPINAGDLDIGVWDISGEEPTRMAVAGAGEPYKVPEIAAFEATMSEYLLTIESTRAPLLGYTLTLTYSNELFDAPFEALDPALADRSGPGEAPTDLSGAQPPAAAADPIVDTGFADLTPPPAVSGGQLLAPAPVIADSDFTGFRSVIDDSLAPTEFEAETAAAVLPTPEDPGAAVLLFWLLVVPFLLLGFVVAVLRRRRPAALQA
jgi:hypothetical protein